MYILAPYMSRFLTIFINWLFTSSIITLFKVTHSYLGSELSSRGGQAPATHFYIGGIVLVAA